MTSEEIWDCIVVGGGAAGLSAALVLGRARRRTLVVDAGEQANLPAHGIGGLLGHDGRPPSELYAMGKRELAGYPAVELREGRVVKVAATTGPMPEPGGGYAASSVDGQPGVREVAGPLFRFELASGLTGSARRVILTSGMSYRAPKIPGLEELWGDTVFHCPFCHGWEARDRPLAMLGQGDKALHGALMISGWSDDVVLLTDGPSGLDADQEAKLAAAGITVDERPVAELLSSDGRLTAIRFTDGTQLERGGLLVAITLRRQDDLADQLGLEVADHGDMIVGAVVVDKMQKADRPGVFAAGDITGQSLNVAGAIASGSMAAAQAVASFLVS